MKDTFNWQDQIESELQEKHPVRDALCVLAGIITFYAIIFIGGCLQAIMEG